MPFVSAPIPVADEDWADGPQMWRVAEKVSNTQSRIADKRWSSSFGIGLRDKTTALNHTKISLLAVVTQNLVLYVQSLDCHEWAFGKPCNVSCRTTFFFCLNFYSGDSKFKWRPWPWYVDVAFRPREHCGLLCSRFCRTLLSAEVFFFADRHIVRSCRHALLQRQPP